MNKKKSCVDCSFQETDDNISHLSYEEQIEFERINTSSLDSIDDEDLKRLAFLLQRIRTQICLGGKTGINETKKNCKYYANLPADFNRDQLLAVFNSISSKVQSRNSNLISWLLGVATIIISLFGISANSENKELKGQIEKLKLESSYLTNSVSNLKDSIGVLNKTIGNNKILTNE